MTNSTSNDDAMDAAETAELLHTTPKRVYALIQSGELPALRLGRRYLLSRSRILEMLREGNVGSDGAGHSTEVRS